MGTKSAPPESSLVVGARDLARCNAHAPHARENVAPLPPSQAAEEPSITRAEVHKVVVGVTAALRLYAGYVVLNLRPARAEGDTPLTGLRTREPDDVGEAPSGGCGPPPSCLPCPVSLVDAECVHGTQDTPLIDMTRCSDECAGGSEPLADAHKRPEQQGRPALSSICRNGAAAVSGASAGGSTAGGPPAAVLLAVDSVRLGGEPQHWGNYFRRPSKAIGVQMQRARLQIYESHSQLIERAARSSVKRGNSVASVSWAPSVPVAAPTLAANPARRATVVAPASASAFCLPPSSPSCAPAPSLEVGANQGSGQPGQASSSVTPPRLESAIEQSLDARLRDAAARADGRSMRFLVLFSGRSRPFDLGEQLRRMQHRVDVVDLVIDESHQLLNPSVQEGYYAMVRDGFYDAVFLAPPCSSFCVALQPQLRSFRQPEGIHPVPQEWRGYLKRHNSLAQFATRICLAAHHSSTQWVVENPASRRYGVAKWEKHVDRASIWDLACFRLLRKVTSAVSVTTAQCGFASPFQKMTTLWCSAGMAPALHRRFAHAVCRCTSHEKVAHGEDEFGASLTALSAEYPPLMCAALARSLVDGALESCNLPAVSVDPSVAIGVHMGSADPHELNLQDDRVVRSRRRPTFALTAHKAASDEELRGRPLPVLNEMEATPPLPQQPAAPHCPPVVTSLRQLLQPIWWQRVSAWMKRLRRCLRLASVGNWRAARRMRPHDLWVTAERCMLPEYAQWDWDLTPCSRGEPAVAFTPSAASPAPPSDSLNRDAFAELRLDPDVVDLGILDEIDRGIADDVVAPRGTFLCAPHAGALRFHDQADARMHAAVSEGWASLHGSVPYFPIRCDPYSVVDESVRAKRPKFRLTNDHSWPPPPCVARR